MELVQRQPAGRGIEQVHDREAESGALRAQVLAGQEEDWPGSGRDDDCLRDEQEVGAGPNPPQRCEEDEDRIDVRRQARDLCAMEVRHLERVAVRRRPDRLHHVPEVEAACRERPLPKDRECCEACGVCRGRREHDGKRADPRHSSSSINPRQRAPRTASLAARS